MKKLVTFSVIAIFLGVAALFGLPGVAEAYWGGAPYWADPWLSGYGGYGGGFGTGPWDGGYGWGGGPWYGGYGGPYGWGGPYGGGGFNFWF